MVDVVDNDEFEGVFLQKVASKVNAEDVSFLPNSQEQASFNRDDIIHKLPKPKTAGGSARRSCQLVFIRNFKKWQVAYRLA